jgi:hypothetical protein
MKVLKKLKKPTLVNKYSSFISFKPKNYSNVGFKNFQNYCSCASNKFNQKNFLQSNSSNSLQLKMSKRILLPTNVKPEVYKLKLEPNLEKFTFDGEQEVTFKLSTPTKRFPNEILLIPS